MASTVTPDGLPAVQARRFTQVRRLTRNDIGYRAVRPLPRAAEDPKAGGAVLLYCLAMVRQRPTPEDAATARRIVLNGLARDAQVFELLGELAPLHPRNDTFPGEVSLPLVADALDWCRASRGNPLPLEGLQARFLPESSFRGRNT